LIGHSMGGFVIAEAARLMPEKVVGIVAIDTFQNVAERTPQSVLDEMVKPLKLIFKVPHKILFHQCFRKLLINNW